MSRRSYPNSYRDPYATGDAALLARLGGFAVERLAGHRRLCCRILARLDHQRDRAHDIVVLEVHHANPGGGSALLGDASGGGPLHHATDADEHELLVLAYHQRTGERALLLGQSDRLDAFGAAVGLTILRDLGALAVAVLGDDQQVHVVASDVHRDHAVG